MAVRVEVEQRTRSGVCAPLGFRAGVAAAGIRLDGNETRTDVAVIRSDTPAVAAGVFTRNTVKAAPVVISQLTLRRGAPISAVVVNAGNANACTGAQGFRDALVMCATTGDALDLDPSDVLVCSTGVIGRPMPMERVTRGIRAAGLAMSSGAGDDVARAIMTTDTIPKMAVAMFTSGGVTYTIGGTAKGAGMIHPDMATLLAFLTTDAPVDATVLQPALSRVADSTFNCVTVDGDTSTNDTCILLANGAAGGSSITNGSSAAAAFEVALMQVCDSLAEQLVADAEGATRHFRVAVDGAADSGQARIAARVVAQSPLVKTAVHGGDPNWGRVVAALGRSGAAFTLDRCRVAIGGVVVFDRGAPEPVDHNLVRVALSSPRIDIAIDLGAGDGSGHAWGCDLSPEYVHINADYTT
ncbi:MAG TPA: bifunctional glutamate N-acetyltransferase/amino-acid acetyltransferase ArgJ [Candidatus Saccharimonadales bacterium]|nr:bifunctional glutamate N-acetyltransferase/amino-acid acetyltransferase ArgJ [Candidatus Saccharimonadales bacterium]